MNKPESFLVQDGLKRPPPLPVTDVLVVSGRDSVADSVSALFRQSGWTIANTRDCADGVSFVNGRRAAVAICDERLHDGSWHDLASAFATIPHAPALIVVSENPDLARHVVALGGFDVLVDPLGCPEDVIWSVASAWHAWWKRYEAERGARCFDA